MTKKSKLSSKNKNALKENTHYDSMKNLFNFLNENVKSMNNSKIFAGLMIIILNVGSKFVNIKLSKTMEAYLKYTFSKQILVFAIAWMGTRDIYIALLITIVFTLFMDFLFNEESYFCFLPKKFKDYHLSLLKENDNSNNNITEEDVKKAQDVIDRYNKSIPLEYLSI